VEGTGYICKVPSSKYLLFKTVWALREMCHSTLLKWQCPESSIYFGMNVVNGVLRKSISSTPLHATLFIKSCRRLALILLCSGIDVHFAVVILRPSAPDLDSENSKCKDSNDVWVLKGCYDLCGWGHWSLITILF